MKTGILVILSVVMAMQLPAQKAFDVPGVRKPHQIAVDGNYLYIFDEADYSLRVYTMSPLTLRTKIGKKGDGPHDFKYLPFVYVRPESLACTDFTKTLWFSKTGEVLRVKNYQDFEDFDLNSEMLLIPIQKNYLRITADHDRQKRHVYLLDSEFKATKELYEGPFIWRGDAPVQYRTDTLIYKDKIFISDTRKGFHIEVFDTGGNQVSKLGKNREIKEIADRPLLHQFCVSEGKIYATTFNKKDNKTEMIVLNLDGRILKRLYLPLRSIRAQRGVLRYDLFTVGREKLYELVKSNDSGLWMLLVTDFGQED